MWHRTGNCQWAGATAEWAGDDEVGSKQALRHREGLVRKLFTRHKPLSQRPLCANFIVSRSLSRRPGPLAASRSALSSCCLRRRCNRIRHVTACSTSNVRSAVQPYAVLPYLVRVGGHLRLVLPDLAAGRRHHDPHRHPLAAHLQGTDVRQVTGSPTADNRRPAHSEEYQAVPCPQPCLPYSPSPHATPLSDHLLNAQPLLTHKRAPFPTSPPPSSTTLP